MGEIVYQRNALVFFATVLLALSFPLTAWTADIYVEKYNLNLSGEIRKGDAERLAIFDGTKEDITQIVGQFSGGGFIRGYAYS